MAATATPSLSASASFSHTLSIKLDDTNFLSWRQQVEGVIRSQKLQSFVINPQIPDRFLSDEDRDANVVNPAYSLWEQQDSALFAWLLSSLSTSLLPSVVSCIHSYQVWDEIHSLFASQSEAQTTKLRSELKSVSKGTQSVADYLQRIKAIVNTLQMIGDPVSFRDHVDAIFDGLPEDFNPLLAVVFQRGSTHSVQDIEAMIVSLDARLTRSRKKQLQDASLNVAHLSQQLKDASINVTQPHQQMPNPSSMVQSQQQAFDPNTFAQHSGGRRHGSDLGPDGRFGGRGGGRGRGRGGRSVQCQIWWKYGHDASICYHRMSGGGPPQYGPPFGQAFSGGASMNPQFGPPNGSQNASGPQNWSQQFGPYGPQHGYSYGPQCGHQHGSHNGYSYGPQFGPQHGQQPAFGPQSNTFFGYGSPRPGPNQGHQGQPCYPAASSGSQNWASYGPSPTTPATQGLLGQAPSSYVCIFPQLVQLVYLLLTTLQLHSHLRMSCLCQISLKILLVYPNLQRIMLYSSSFIRLIVLLNHRLPLKFCSKAALVMMDSTDLMILIQLTLTLQLHPSQLYLPLLLLVLMFIL